jgi:hypothetical protein
MSLLWMRSRRGVGLALLLALIAGPTGLAGVLHPYDDVEYRSSSPAGPSVVCQAVGAAGEPDVHCPTCHLLRSVRWGVSATAAPGLVPQAMLAGPWLVQAIPLADPQFTQSGRSPPTADSSRTA